MNESTANHSATSRVVVLMAAYDAAATIGEAVRSILDNTLAADLLVIDDCSPRPMAEVLGDLLAAHPERLRVMRMPVNSRQSACLNAGLLEMLPKGYAYVALMDADDIALPERLAEQVAFLDAHPEIGAVGTWMQTFDETTLAPMYVHRHPVDDAGIRQAMYFNSAVVHPSMMVRAEVFRTMGGYNPVLQGAEDYELWRRIQSRWKLANLPRVLLRYRLSSKGQSMAGRRRQLAIRLKVQLIYFRPSAWRAWGGVLLTLMLFLVPMRALLFAKARMWRD